MAETLIEKLEAATEGSRELDEVVANAGGVETHWIGDGTILAEKWTQKRIPRYTTSIDAALTLVPDNFDWQLIRAAGDDVFPNEVQLWSGSFYDGREGGEWYADAATMPLAICIAALKARNAQCG